MSQLNKNKKKICQWFEVIPCESVSLLIKGEVKRMEILKRVDLY